MKTTEFIVETSLIAQEADVMHQDHEVQMARADCYNAAQYAIELHKLLKHMSEEQGLEGWVSEKITLANDYLRTVAEYLRHEQAHKQADMMAFAEDAANYALDTMLNESYVGRETKDGVWRVFKNGQAVAVAGPFKSREEAHAWIKNQKQGMAEGAKWRKTHVAKKVTDPEGEDSISYDYHTEYPRSTGAMRATSDSEPPYHSLNARPKAEIVSRGNRQGKITKSHGERLKSRIKAGLNLAEDASGGASSAGSIAVSMSGPAGKPGTGKPKKIGNAAKMKKVQVGKGVY